MTLGLTVNPNVTRGLVLEGRTRQVQVALAYEHAGFVYGLLVVDADGREWSCPDSVDSVPLDIHTVYLTAVATPRPYVPWSYSALTDAPTSSTSSRVLFPAVWNFLS
jgi:hypothetical protein